MTTRGQFNTKSPTIKRILKEASELSTSPSADYYAEPQETNLFEWHFTIRGPPAPSPYHGGIYHGRIILPPQYPLRPPAFRFLTPTGRFEVNREICLSISGHHEETWQPAWGVRTALVAIRSFMDTDAKGQLGGIECSREAREKMAKDSGTWKCAACAKSNADIMHEREDLVRESQDAGGKAKEEKVPEELRLAYRDELGSKGGEGSGHDKGKAEAVDVAPPSLHAPSSTSPVAPAVSTTNNAATAASTQQKPPATRTIRSSTTHQPTQPSTDRSIALIDTLIYGIVAALLFMVLRRLV
ncbi:ubiquitin-conjugating enzyme/RWD-like protein [Phaeosphaeria sp. MPI-PUGE-AT-0046c]|nr:ubiquitin-conjugating enzyme/RWD-like protein [Phaeosphaeria sp. MPI-PUGE-AT-0046c]